MPLSPAWVRATPDYEDRAEQTEESYNNFNRR